MRDVKPIVVRTSYGAVTGFAANESPLSTFRGVPFASCERFMKPKEPTPWSEPLDCQQYGKSAIQPPLPSAGKALKAAVSSLIGAKSGLLRTAALETFMGETDCLNLNICTPNVIGKAPVMVFIHGGGFLFGAGSQIMYNHSWGSKLTSEQGICFVTINYRLGAFGFLPVPGGDKNVGIWDQIQALQWVQSEISKFGGDPDNVCIFGESAGGMSCGTLIAAPAASPLFHRAILMSGACSNCMTECDSLSLTTEFEHALKLPVGGLSVTSAGPQNISAARLLETQMKMFGIQGLMPFQPCVDGDLLPDSPLECVRAGSAIGKSIVVGCNASEWGLFHPLIPVLSSFTSRRAALTRVAGVLGPGKMDVLTPGGPDSAAQEQDGHKDTHTRSSLSSEQERERTFVKGIFNMVKAENPTLANNQEVLNQLYTQIVFSVPALLVADAFSEALQNANADPLHPLAHVQNKGECFVYRFDFAASALGAAHAVELGLLFGTYKIHWVMEYFSGFRTNPHNAERLSRQMQCAWCSFAATGTPQPNWRGGSELDSTLEWPKYTVSDSRTRPHRPKSRCHSSSDRSSSNDNNNNNNNNNSSSSSSRLVQTAVKAEPRTVVADADVEGFGRMFVFDEECYVEGPSAWKTPSFRALLDRVPAAVRPFGIRRTPRRYVAPVTSGIILDVERKRKQERKEERKVAAAVSRL